MKKAWSAILIPALALVLAGVGSPVLTGCSDKVCTTEEEAACTTTYTTCVNTAAAAGDAEGGKKCGDSYCSCFDARPSCSPG